MLQVPRALRSPRTHVWKMRRSSRSWQTWTASSIGAELAVQFAEAGHEVIAACRAKSAHVHALAAARGVASKVRVLLGLDVESDAKTDAFFDALKNEGVALDANSSVFSNCDVLCCDARRE